MIWRKNSNDQFKQWQCILKTNALHRNVKITNKILITLQNDLTNFFFTKLDLLTRNDASAIEKPITLRIMVIRKYINHDLMQTNIHQFDVYRNFPISQFKDQRTLAWTIYRKARTRIECQTLFIKTVDISKKNAIFAVIFYYKSFLKTTTYLPNKHFLQNTHVYFAGLLSID